MESAELEYKVREIAIRIDAGQQVEDDRVEVKRAWIRTWKAAWRIGGHANAAGAEPILWVFGLDEQGEKGKRVVGIETKDQAAWISEVESNFVGFPPHRLREMAIIYQDKTLFAILFGTDRAPYVVKNPKGGPVQYGVPWRDGTRVRTARHEDLIEVLVPQLRLPDIDPVSGYLRFERYKKESCYWNFELRVFITPRSSKPIVVPFYRMEAKGVISDYRRTLGFEDVALKAPTKFAPGTGSPYGTGRVRSLMDVNYVPDSHTIESTNAEAVIHGPGIAVIKGTCRTGEIRKNFSRTTAKISVKFKPAESNKVIEIKVPLKWNPATEKTGEWNLFKD